jgi:hypothetical protein
VSALFDEFSIMSRRPVRGSAEKLFFFILPF